MKIRYPVIVSIVLFIATSISSKLIGTIPIMGAIPMTELLILLWLLSLLWIAYAIIAKICRTIYRAVKSRANHPEKSPLEP